jgi:hypothetical protein
MAAKLAAILFLPVESWTNIVGPDKKVRVSNGPLA